MESPRYGKPEHGSTMLNQILPWSCHHEVGLFRRAGWYETSDPHGFRNASRGTRLVAPLDAQL